MTPAAVGALYDALLAFEHRRRGAEPYPIHKRVGFGTNHQDVYEWLADELSLRSTDRVLDVGCGVGFGTLRLAERGVARVTGLTVSRRELDLARRAATRSARAGSIEILEGSFDDLPRSAFDVVIAVEALKHSKDVAFTLPRIYDALAPGGRLAVVEDVFDGDPTCASALRVVSDWRLTRLYRETDYVTSSPLGFRVVDLTDGVRTSSRFSLAGKLFALDLALRCQGPSRAAALQAFRGGLHLERLYAAGMMRYVAMFASKQRAESP